MDEDMGDPGGVTTVSSSELRSELRALADEWRERMRVLYTRLNEESDDGKASLLGGRIVTWRRASQELDRLLRNNPVGRQAMTAHQFAQDYEWRGDFDHVPTDFERDMIEDAILSWEEHRSLGHARQDPADPHPRDEQQPLQETDHDR